MSYTVAGGVEFQERPDTVEVYRLAVAVVPAVAFYLDMSQKKRRHPQGGFGRRAGAVHGDAHPRRRRPAM